MEPLQIHEIRIDVDRLVAGLARHWWALLLRGLLALAFAVFTWLQPALSITAMVLVFGAWVLVEGLLGIWAAWTARGSGSRSWLLLLWGLVSVIAGLLTLAMPGVTAIVLLYFIAAWACVTGVLQVLAAIRLRKFINNEWWLILAGVLSLLFGVLLFASPFSGALAIAWLIASYAFILGVLLVLLSLRLRRLRR